MIARHRYICFYIIEQPIFLTFYEQSDYHWQQREHHCAALHLQTMLGSAAGGNLIRSEATNNQRARISGTVLPNPFIPCRCILSRPEP